MRNITVYLLLLCKQDHLFNYTKTQVEKILQISTFLILPNNRYKFYVEHSADLPPLDIVNHLVDLFFKNVNSVFPFVHRTRLKRSIQDGSVSRPLLYSVLAISAR
jgi:hypothetical protein